MKRLKIIALGEYIDKLTDEEKMEIAPWYEFEEEASNGDLYDFIIEKQIETLQCLTEDNIDELKRIVNKKEANIVSEDLLSNFLVFESEKNIYITGEVNNYIKELDKEIYLKERKQGVIAYYIIANGVLKETKLIELCEKTGIIIDKKDINEVIKKLGFIRRKDVIYINMFAVSLEENANILKIKEQNEYKVFDIREILENVMYSPIEDYLKDIEEIIKKKSQDKDLISEVTHSLFYLAESGYEYEDFTKGYLESVNINLNPKEWKKLIEILNEINEDFPIWIENGFANYEIDSDEDYNIEDYSKLDFDMLSKKDKTEAYLYAYILINGLIHIDKFIEILSTYHDIKADIKEIKKIINNNDDLYNIEGYICGEKLDKEPFLVILSSKKETDYKIIGDIDEFYDDVDRYEVHYDEICNYYGIDEEASGLIRYMLNIGKFNEEVLPYVFEDCNIKMALKKQRQFINDLKPVIRNLRLWCLNGFKQCEVHKEVSKVKIGRNEKCPCGSGKKYKQCCGK